MIASFGNLTLLIRVEFPKLAIMKPLPDQPRPPPPHQDDYAYRLVTSSNLITIDSCSATAVIPQSPTKTTTQRHDQTT